MRKHLFIIFIFIIATGSLFAQTKNKSIEEIRTHFKWINSQKDFVAAELNNEDFLDQTPDNGAQLMGLYKNDTLFKIIEWTGLSYAIMTTEYYFWNNKLIFVYDTEKNYKQINDSIDGFIGFDYNEAKIMYESRHYFIDGKEIQKIEKGKRLIELLQPKDFFSSLKLIQPLLDNKKDNQADYNKIQGNWISTIDSLYTMKFDGLTKTEYYNGKYSDYSKIKIDKQYLYCWTVKGKDEYKYEIMSLSNNDLTLLYLPAGNLLTFKKRNDR